MANRTLLEKEIREYCNINNIADVPGFITQCMLQGFNVYRYGTSPQDNKKRENGEIENITSNRTKKKEAETETKPSTQESNSQIKVTKRKVKIISK